MADQNQKMKNESDKNVNPLYLATQSDVKFDTQTDNKSVDENTKKLTSDTQGSPHSSSVSDTPSEENLNDVNKTVKNLELRGRKESDRSMEDREADIVCPRVNCPEKIVICLDVSVEMDAVIFRSRSGDKFAPLKLVKRALGIFVHTKHKLDPRHEFALVILHDTAIWVCDFTNDPNKVLTILQGIPGSFQAKSFDLASLFDELKKQVCLPKVEDATIFPPPYIVRVLLLYGRSYCVPSFSDAECWKVLQASPHFFLDAYYIHEPPSEDNQCEDIFNILCDLDKKGLYYIFEVSRNPTKLYDCMAQLLPHALQRPLQKDSSYTLEPKVKQQEVPVQ